MGRSAGWLAYGVAIAGEASLVISVEDIDGPYATTEDVTHPKTGQVSKRKVMDVDKVIKRIVLTMTTREREGKEYGVIVIAEGLAELLPEEIPGRHRPRRARPHQHRGRQPARHFHGPDRQGIHEADRQEAQRSRALQLGYESRCAKPHAFDVMLGSQLGVGAYRALVEKGLNGVMVSVSGQLQLHYVPFEELVDPEHARDGRPLHRSRTATSTG